MLTVDHVLQVFDNTPASKEGTLESGDELVGINDTNVKVIFCMVMLMLILILMLMLMLMLMEMLMMMVMKEMTIY